MTEGALGGEWLGASRRFRNSRFLLVPRRKQAPFSSGRRGGRPPSSPFPRGSLGLARRDRFAALIGLTALGLSWPVLDLLGRNVEFFVVRRSSTMEILALALLLVLGIPLLLAVLGSLPGKVGAVLGAALIVVVASFLALLYLRRVPISWWLATALAVIVGAAMTWAIHRLPAAQLLSRFLMAAPLAMLALFLFATPTGALLTGRDSVSGARLSSEKVAPVVMLVFDELPVATLIDPSGNLRSDRYPNFARLAADGVWFRNAVTLHDATEYALPAMLTGLKPELSQAPYAAQHPNNLIVALSDTHELHVYESITQLCPESLCESTRAATTPVLRDVGIVAGHVLLPEPIADDLPQIDAAWSDFGTATPEFDTITAFREIFDADPRIPIEAFIDDIGQTSADSVPFHFLHTLVPHHPWQFLADGRRYPLDVERAPGRTPGGWGDDDFLLAQASQRLLLQVEYVDFALGQILAALDDAGIYDEALIVVASDHGIAVKHDVDHQRRITTETIGEIAAVALFVKAPGGPSGVIDDRRAHTTDIVPTIADVLDAKMPWRVDGFSLLGPDPGRSATTTFGPDDEVTFGAEGQEKLEVAARFERWFPDGDLWALRPRSSPEILGDELEVATLESAEFSAAIEFSELYDAVDVTNDAIPTRITGALDGQLDGTEVLAIVVNDTVGALTRSYLVDDEAFFQAMVPSNLLVDGGNDVAVLHVRDDGRLVRVERTS